eukprot:TRINITY_DN23644_c0_g1_i3.p1 TRINITY_DN23644_c0_g1~~TRINITY_DN23644_c0_g1_i3.p1  ORF type:complete len:261 (+),score=87.21 TRINITY_DN23644_c0_g1_i3:83-865(+)
MSISTAPKQGQGMTDRGPPKPIDRRLFGVGCTGFVTGILVLVAAVPLPYLTIDLEGVDAGELTLWRANLKQDVLSNIGVEDELDPTTRKAITLYHAAGDRRHRQVAEEIVGGFVYCQNNVGVESTCSGLKDMSRLFLTSQGKILPALSLSLASLVVLPITSMRTTNQALVFAVIALVAFCCLLGTTINIAVNLEDHTKDALQAAFPSVDVTLKWGAGAVALFASTGTAGLFLLGAAGLSVWTRSDPYDPWDGPNYDESNV